MTAHDVYMMLKAKYAPPAYAMLREVRNATGYQGQVRYADVLMMSLYPSRGLELTGIEIKVSRSDWQAELAKPAKAEAFVRYCDRWYVAAPKGVVKVEELPPQWGLYEVNSTVKVAKHAAQLKPCAPDRPFLASLFRASSEQSVDEIALKQQWEEGRKHGYTEAERQENYQALRTERELADLRATVQEFEAKAGVRINSWHMGDIKEALEWVRTCGTAEKRINQIEHAHRIVRETEHVIARALEKLRATELAPEPARGEG